MPFHRRVIDQGRIILLRAVGPADLEDWYALLQDPDLPRKAPRAGLLVDLRRRQSLPSAAGAREVGERLAQLASGPFVAAAILARLWLLEQVDGPLPGPADAPTS